MPGITIGASGAREPGSQLPLVLNENKLQVGKKTDLHIRKRKKKEKHTNREVYKVIITYECKNIKKENHTNDDYDN